MRNIHFYSLLTNLYFLFSKDNILCSVYAFKYWVQNKIEHDWRLLLFYIPTLWKKIAKKVPQSSLMNWYGLNMSEGEITWNFNVHVLSIRFVVNTDIIILVCMYDIFLYPRCMTWPVRARFLVRMSLCLSLFSVRTLPS